MPQEPSWKIDVKSLSTKEIVRLLRQLDESKYKEALLDLRRELVQQASGYSAQFGQAFRSNPAGCSGDSGRGRSEATLEFFS